MKKIVLLKDHHQGDQIFREGEEIEVSDEVYDFLISYYMDLRKVQVEQESQAEKVLKKMKG